MVFFAAVLANLCLLAAIPARANPGPNGFNIQGTLYGPSGAAYEGIVAFKVQVLDAGAACVLYQETHNLDLTTTKGVFSIDLGQGTSRSNKVDSSTTLGSNVFRNDVNIPAGVDCVPGVTFTSGAARLVRVLYDVGSGETAMSPDLTLRGSPYSAVAETLQGKSPSQFLQPNSANALTQLNLETIFAGGNFAKLTNLLAGNSTDYVSRVVTTPSTGTDAANKTYVDGTIGGKTADTSLTTLAPGDAGKVLSWDGTKWVAQTAAAGGTGTVTSVQIAMPSFLTVTGGPITTSGVITAALASQAGGSVFAGPASGAGTPSFRALTASDIPTIDGAKVSGGTIGGSTSITTSGNVSAANLSSRGVTVWDSDNTNSILLQAPPTASLTSNYSLTLPTSAGTAGQVLTTTGSGTLSWTTPSAGGGGDVTIGGNTVASTMTIGTNSAQRLDLETNGATRMTVASSGFVGIGATNPSHPFTIIGNAATDVLKVQNTDPTGWAGLSVYGDNGNQAGYLSYGNSANGLPQYQNVLVLGTNGASDINVTTNGTDRMRISSGGNVGVGTSNPQTRLDVNGAIKLGTGTCGATTQGSLQFSGGNIQYCNTSNVWTTLSAGGSSQWTTNGSSIGYTGQVGIGTTNPLYELHVADPGGTSTQIKLTNNTGSTASDGADLELVNSSLIIRNNESGLIDFTTAGTTRMAILASGKIGIGTTNPNAALHVVENSNSDKFIEISNDNSGASAASGMYFSGETSGNQQGWIGYNASASSQAPYAGRFAVASTSSNNNGLSLIASNSGDIRLYTVSNTERMRIASNGSIGIGTTNPATLLDVAGSIKLGTGTCAAATQGSLQFSGGNIQYCNTSNVWTTLSAGGSGDVVRGGNTQASGTMVVGTNDAFPLAFETNNTTRITITSSGTVGIGTTNPTAGKLEVVTNSGTGDVVAVRDTGAGGFSEVSFLDSDGTNGGWIGHDNASDKIYINSAGTRPISFATYGGTSERLRIDATTGNIGIGTTSPAAALDVSGAIKLGTGTCAAATQGSLQFSGGNIQYCNTSNVWTTLSSGGSGDVVNGGNTVATTMVVGTNSGFGLSLRTNSTSRLTIDSTGKVGVGRVPTYALDTLTASSSPVRFQTTSTNVSNFEFLTDGAANAIISGVVGGTANFLTFDTIRGTQSAKSDVVSGDVLGVINFAGNNKAGASISAQTEGAPNAAVAANLRFYTAPDGLTAPIERMRVAADGRVGIGVTGPVAALDVAGAVKIANDPTACSATNAGALRFNGTSAQLCVSNAWTTLSSGGSGDVVRGGNTQASGTMVVGTNDAFPLAFETNNTTRITITNAGDVGVGTTNPSVAFQVVGNAMFESSMSIMSTLDMGGPIRAANGTATNPGYKFVFGGTTGLFLAGNGTDTIGVSTAGTERMRIDSTGAIGIGTTNPATKLDVNGSIKLGTGTCAAATQGSLQFTGGNVQFCNTSNVWTTLSSGGSGDVVRGGNTQSSGTMIVGTNDAFPLAFETNNTTRMIFDNSGQVAIGRATTDANYNLTLGRGTQNFAGMVMYNNTATSGFGVALDPDSPNAFVWNSNTNGWLTFGTSGTERMTILSNGAIGIGTTAPVNNVAVVKDQNATTSLLISNSTNGNAAETALYLKNDGGNNSYLGLISQGSANAVFSNRLVLGASNSHNGVSILSENGSGDFRVYTGGAVSTNERFRILSGGNVGIGTTNPATLLDVAGSIKLGTGTCAAATQGSLQFSGGNIQYCNTSNVWTTLAASASSGTFLANNGTPSAPTHSFTGDPNTGMYNVTADTLGFSTNNTNRLTIGATGTIGIGTTNPSGTFEIAETLGNTIINGVGMRMVNTTTSGGGSYVNLIRPTSMTAGGTVGRFSFASGSAGSNTVRAGIEATATENWGTNFGTRLDVTTTPNGTNTSVVAMSFEHNGNVGVGTTNPMTKQVIVGTPSWKPIAAIGKSVGYTAASTVLSDSYYLGIGHNEAGAGSYRLIGFGYNNDLDTHYPAFVGYQETNNTAASNGDLIFGTRATTTAVAASERMRIAANGNVGIGTTLPAATLDVNGIVKLGTGTCGATTQGSIQFTSNQIQYCNTSNTWTALGTGSATAAGSTGDIQINSSNALGSGSLRFSTTNNTLGVGAAVGYSSTNNAMSLYRSAGSIYYIQMHANGTGGNSGDGTLFGVNGTDTVLNNQETGNLLLSTSGSERLRITSAGFVGIGDAAPLSQLSVVKTTTGTASVTNATTTHYLNLGSASSAGKFNGMGGDVYVQSTSAALTGGAVTATYGYFESNSPAGVNTARGVWGGAWNNSAGTIAKAAGAEFESGNNLSTGTITNAYGATFGITRTAGTIHNGYGISIGNIDATSKFAIHSTDATAKVYIAGNVGLGTTNPATTLDVVGSIKLGTGTCAAATQGSLQFSGGNIQYCNTSNVWTTLGGGGDVVRGGNTQTSGTMVIGTNDAFPVALETNGTSRLHIDTSGNVGIGNTASNPLHVERNQNAATFAILQNTDSGASAEVGVKFVNNASSSPFSIGVNSTGYSSPSQAGAGYIWQQNSTPIIFATSGSEGMRLTSTGQLGIGTTVPTARLDLQHSTSATSGTIIGTNTKLTGALPVGSTATYIGQRATLDHVTSNGTLTAIYGSEGNAFHTGTLGNVTTAVGVRGVAQNTTTGGTTTSAYGVSGNVDFNSNGATITTAAGLHAKITKTGVGTLTNAYGVYIDSVAGTNKFGIYENSSGNNYFAGNVGIGQTAPATKLDVNGSIKLGTGACGATTQGSLQFSGGNIQYCNTSNVWTTLGGGGGDVINGGNTVAATMVVGTNSAHRLDLETNGTVAVTVGTNQSVGIGTTAPTAKLDVTGQIHTTVYNAGTSMAIDFNNGNNQYNAPTGNACGAITLSNLLDGGTYTVAVQGVTSGTCVFSQGALTFVYNPANTAVASDAVYTFLRMGNKVYVSWVTGFQ